MDKKDSEEIEKNIKAAKRYMIWAYIINILNIFFLIITNIDKIVAFFK